MFISHLHEQHNSSLRIIPFALLLGKNKNKQPTNQKDQQTNKQKKTFTISRNSSNSKKEFHGH